MEWTLCHRCLSDFRTAGKDLRRVSHIHFMDWCDFCSHRMGYTYREVKHDRGRDIPHKVGNAADTPTGGYISSATIKKAVRGW